MSTAIEFKNVTKSYGDNTILKDFNLKIEEGDFVVMIGTSGCGKTTALKLINRLITPESGEILVNGKNIANEDIINLRRHIGYSIQGNLLFPHMNVRDNILYVPDLYDKKDEEYNKKALKKWMKLIDLPEDYLKRYPKQLSGGQQQRVGIARAMANEPEILLMDEPFGAIDAITRTQLQKKIKAIHEQTGVTIVFVTHDISEAIHLGNKVVIMEKGKIDQYDTPENIIDHPATEFAKNLIGDNTLEEIAKK
ncbi:MAG: ABC transporter ATP-binding protein [Methanobacteriaceae archaeon]|nr:ABC transporter ATP-binding protein [Methanobacteriaceae archaeon]